MSDRVFLIGQEMSINNVLIKILTSILHGGPDWPTEKEFKNRKVRIID